MYKRFTWERHQVVSGDDYFSVLDREAGKFNLPTRATTMFFSNKENAMTVADILNKEWINFLNNPD